jgi:hypothetical protein
MQHGNNAVWSSPTPAGERPEFGSTVIPDHPGYLMPSPGALHRAFETAIAELERGRGREPRRSAYAAQSQEAVYEAGMRALSGSLVAIYQEFHRDNPNAISLPYEIIPEMQQPSGYLSLKPSRADSRVQSRQRQEHEREGVHVGGGTRRF